MRERLIELIANEPNSIDSIVSHADYLLANGVIVPPCKVGDKVYVLLETSCEDIDGAYTTCEFYRDYEDDLCILPKGKCPYICRIAECLVTDVNLIRFTAEWNKTVFLTREEAEQALKGGEG